MPKNASANWKNNCVAPRKNDDGGEGWPNASYCHWISTAPVSSVTRAVGSPDRPARSPLQRTHAWRRDGPAFCGAQGRSGGGPGWWKPDTCWPKTLIPWCGHAWLRVGEDTACRGGRNVSLNGIATSLDKLGMSGAGTCIYMDEQDGQDFEHFGRFRLRRKTGALSIANAGVIRIPAFAGMTVEVWE